MLNLDEEYIQQTLGRMCDHGIDCGIKIANVVKDLHPDAIVIVPLHRSCFVVTQNDIEKENGKCTMYLYTDPHWFGDDIDIDTLRKKKYHKTVDVYGNTGDNAWAWNWVWK